jgi:hypothetical protein
MKNLAAPAKFTLTKTTVARFTKAAQPAGLAPTFGTSVVETTSVF